MTEEQSYFYRTADDEAVFNRASVGLQGLGPGEPYHCGPHNMRAFKFALQQVPKARVFEVGFNLGYSAAVMLELGAEHVESIDIRNTPKMQLSAQTLGQHYKGRLTVHFGTTVQKLTTILPADLAYIDGGHEHADVLADVQFCLKQGLKRFLFDDWPPMYGPGVQPVIREMDLLPIAVVGSLCYAVVPGVEGYFNPWYPKAV